MATDIDLNGFDESAWHPETLGVRAGNQMTAFGDWERGGPRSK